MTEHDKNLFIKEYSSAVKEDNAAVFAGAGLSIPAGFVNWRELLREIATDLGLEIDDETDLIAIAQYHFNKHKRAKINTLIAKEFLRGTTITSNHEILSRLPIKTYWTTNYDTLIEESLRQAFKTPDVKIHKGDFSRPIPKRDAVVYKMHGDISDVSKAIITRDDYETYDVNRRVFTTALQGDLSTKTFLFIGFSFDDPNLSYILSRIRILLEENQVKHYCFFKKVSRDQYDDSEDGERKFIREELRQELKIKDLERYNINAYLVDNYAEITELLEKVEARLKRQSVFISGSAEEYGRWNRENANNFVYRLSYELAKKYKIVTGFGLGIGSSVINGVLEHLYKTDYRHLDDALILRPFPQNPPPNSDLGELWQKYRQEILSNAGIAIFMFGNKVVDGKIVQADGVRKEFDIAISKGVKVIPIGATGYMAREIWEEVNQSYDDYFPANNELKKAISLLGEPTISEDDIINNVVKAVGILHHS